MLKRLQKKLVAWLGPSLAYWTIKALSSTMKFKEVHSETPRFFGEKGIPGIGAFWHGRLLMMPLVYKGKKLSFLVSPHRDGQIVGKALKRFGFHAILGSTNRKGFSAFKQMLRANRDGSDIALTPDGPKGPRYQVQIGVIELAKRRNGDELNIYLETAEKEWFYFNYSNHIMQSISSDELYNSALSELKDTKRIQNLENSKNTYQYIISTRQKMIEFISRMQAAEKR